MSLSFYFFVRVYRVEILIFYLLNIYVMKKKLSMWIILLALANMSFAFADEVSTSVSSIKTYSTGEAFLEAEGQTCESATDWCNTISVNNGEFGASTMMYCEGEKEYSCLSEKKAIEEDDEMPMMCTMQYDPVCWINGQTYGNSCMAQGAEVAYQWECESMVDLDYLNTLNNNVVQITKIEAVLWEVSTEQLGKLVVLTHEYIESTKLTRIAVEMQISRITKLTFLKNLFNKELSSRY